MSKRLKAERNTSNTPNAVPPAKAMSSAVERGPRGKAILRGQKLALADLERAGGALTLQEVCRLLGNVSRSVVSRLGKQGCLFTIPGPGGRKFYPALQFSCTGEVEPWVGQLLNVIPTKNPWMLLNYLVNPDDTLDDRIPINLLQAGQVELVLAAAKDLARLGA